MKEEIWRIIKDFPDYAVSNWGRVMRITKGSNNTYPGKILKPGLNSGGYKMVVLSKNGKNKTKTIHRVMVKSFLNNYSDNLEVNHKNGIKTDNRIENLEMVTRSENQRHAYKNNLQTSKKGDANGRATLASKQVYLIKKILYFRKKAKLKIKIRKIAKIFKTSENVISLINCGYTWSHINYP